MLCTLLRALPLTLLCTIHLLAFAQTIPDLPTHTPSGTYLNEGLSHYANQDYALAINSFNKVNENDTNYTRCLIDQAAAYLLQKKYDDALRVSKEGLELKLPDRDQHYITASASLVDVKKHEENLELLSDGLTEFPYNNTLSIFKVTSLVSTNQHDEARKELNHQLRYNHRNAGMHRKVATLALNESDYTRALLAAGFALVLEPQTDLSTSLLFKTNESVRSKTEHESENFSFDSEDNVDDFSEINLLIENYVALNKKFKTPAKLNTAIIKQLYLVLTKVDYDGDGLFSDYYLPIYKKILDQDRFRMFAYCLLASSRSESHKELVAKYNSQIRTFRDWFLEEMRLAHGKQEVTLNGNTVETSIWFDDDGSVLLIGDLDESTGTPLGDIEIYYPSGTLKGAGTYANGKKNGLWNWYYENAQLKESGNYIADKPEGILKGYNQRGRLTYEIPYSKGLANGKVTYYDDYGNITLKRDYVNDKITGLETYYYPFGQISYEIGYQENQLEGIYKEYFANGEISVEGQFKDGSRSGEFTSYHINGKVHSTYNYTDGFYEGALEEFFENGQLARKGDYLKGKEVGEWKTYYKDGTLETHLVFDESGKYNGTIIDYDIDGKKMVEREFKKGKLITYRAFKKDGSIRDEGNHKGKIMPFVEYDALGTILTKGSFKAGEKDGDWEYFHPNGIIEKKENHVDGKTQGTVLKYFNTGQLEYVYKVKDGLVDSKFYEYRKNGKTYCEGWYSGGNKTGEWKYYYSNGELSSKSYFLDDEKVGKNYDYDITGTISGVDILLNGQLTKIIDYDTNGNELTEVDLLKPVVVSTLFYDDGKTVQSAGRYVSGVAHGDFKWFYPNGELRTEGNFINGNRHGEWNWYYYNGDLSTTCTYQFGELHGEWIEYFENGKVSKRTPYERDNIVGLNTAYYENGKPSYTTEYKNGETHGKMTFYAEDGNIEHFRYYYHGTIVAYSYLDQNGNEIDRIPISNQTAKIETFYKNGNMSRSYELKNGLFHGTYSKYHPSGNLISHKQVVDGMDQGESKEYADDGTLIAIRNYKDDKTDGFQQTFHKNGKLKETSHYIDGTQHGKRKRYDTSGNLISTLTYHSGTLVAID